MSLHLQIWHGPAEQVHPGHPAAALPRRHLGQDHCAHQPEHQAGAVIDPARSRDLNTGLWLVSTSGQEIPND